jgi:hypothetical protein
MTQLVVHTYASVFQKIINELAYLLTELSPSREAANCAATQKFPAFNGTRTFITVFTRALHWSLS